MKKNILSTITILSFAFYAIFIVKNDTLGPVPKDAVVVEKKRNATPAVVNNTLPTKPTAGGIYKDGTYLGPRVDAYYGYIQVQAVIQNSQLADVIFLDHPQDRGTSIRINNYAMPILKTEAIKSQNAKVDIVSGATDSSQAFRESLTQALAQAAN